MKSGKIILGLAVALLLPLSFYLVAKLLHKDRIYLPAYYLPDGCDSIMVDGKFVCDTLYHQLNDITLYNQLGEKVSLNQDLSGKILVVNFFFTGCATTCPKLMSNMAMLQKAFRDDPKKEFKVSQTIQFLSISVTPEIDSPAVLRAYAERYNANHDKWWLLTGDKSSIYQYARKELGLITGSGEGGMDDFIHSDRVVLIDSSRYVRGYYDGLDAIALKKCAEDAVLLTMEKKRKKKK